MNLKPEYQIVTIDTLLGTKSVKAPSDWEFDKTAKFAWDRMLGEVRLMYRIKERRHTKAELAKHQAKLDALSEVMAAALGMAPFYWEQSAIEFATYL